MRCLRQVYKGILALCGLLWQLQTMAALIVRFKSNVLQAGHRQRDPSVKPRQPTAKTR